MSLPINEIALILLLQTTPTAPIEHTYQEFSPTSDQQIEISQSTMPKMLLATPNPNFPPVPKPEPTPPPRDPPKIPVPDDGGTDPTPDDDDDREEDRDEDGDDDSGPGDTDAGSESSFGRFY